MERSQKKKSEKIFFLRIAQKPLFSPLLSLSVSFFDRRGDVPMRGSDRHQSAEIKNKRALLRVLSSSLRGSVIGHVFNSASKNTARRIFQKLERKKIRNKELSNSFRGYTRARVSSNRSKRTKRDKNNNGQLLLLTWTLVALRPATDAIC